MEEATNGNGEENNNNNNGERMMVKASDIAEKKKKKEISEEIHLKNMIATHPLYGLLIESHFNCLKVGLDEIAECEKANDAEKLQIYNSKPKATTPPPSSSELDHFMEAYCLALSKLKESIEEPTRETKAFINATYIELKDLIIHDHNYNNNNNIIIIEDPNDEHHSHGD